MGKEYLIEQLSTIAVQVSVLQNRRAKSQQLNLIEQLSTIAVQLSVLQNRWAKIWQLNLIEQLSTIAVQVSVLQNRWAKIWQLNLTEQLSTIAVQVSVLQNRWAKGCCLACMFPYREKLSNFNISTLQSWTSPIGTGIEEHCKKMEKWPITCYCRLQGNERMAYESLPMSLLKSQCACADGMSRNSNLYIIFKWLSPTKTKKCLILLTFSCSFQQFDQFHPGTIMLLLTNCEVHTGKYLDRSFKYGPNEVRSVQNAKVQIFSPMDRTNWSIRALLYSHNQHLGFILDKMILNWIIMTIYTSDSFSSIIIWILPKFFPIPLSHLKRSFH